MLPSRPILDRLNALQINAHRAIDAMPEPEQRSNTTQKVRLKILRKRSMAEVAKIMGVSEQYVQKTLWIALKKIERNLVERGVV